MIKFMQGKNLPILICFLVYIFCLILYLLMAIDYVSDPPVLGIIGISSIAASIFILLVRLDREAASYKNIILGYVVAISTGITFHWAVKLTGANIFSTHNSLLFESISSLSIIVTISLFLILRIDHPPAVGMMLGLVLEHWTLISLCVFVSSVLGLLLFRRLLVRSSIRITHL